ncbi:FAD-binding domain-containing protein [Mycena metata]|uniref:FAD-binding domain-containing protein n=1 Tax=Mycena metata TaxID=1033252 RepID=A0AAD7JBR6_9AGAR|nr:FAD-binding domain-containing protein [Mycena metata]
MFIIFSLPLLFTLPLARANSSSLASCLSDNDLTVEGPENSTWATSTTPFNMRFHYVPNGIVYPTQTSDISKAVKCAVKFGLHVSALSGGHSYSASGYGSRNGALVLNFRDMSQVDYDASDETATIQPGARLGDVALELDKYGRALAHGFEIGGHAGFGGWGFASRIWGLLIDQLVAANIVLPNGTAAIRGAASSFGIISQYIFKTHEAPSSVVRYSLSFSNPDLSADKFTQLLNSYQSWGRTAPKELGMEANVFQGGRVVELGGYYMGSTADFKGIFNSLLRETGPPNDTYVQERSWIAALVEVNGGSPLSTKGQPDTHATFFAKSLVVPTASPLTNSSLSELAKSFAKTKIPSTLSWFIQFELWGGGDSVISSIPTTATAYPHRAHLWTIQFYAYSNTTWPSEGTIFVNGLVSTITDNTKGTKFGAYANYLDPTLTAWREKYYAGNYARLANLQEQIDPNGVFMKAQNIGALDF